MASLYQQAVWGRGQKKQHTWGTTVHPLIGDRVSVPDVFPVLCPLEVSTCSTENLFGSRETGCWLEPITAWTRRLAVQAGEMAFE